METYETLVDVREGIVRVILSRHRHLWMDITDRRWRLLLEDECEGMIELSAYSLQTRLRRANHTPVDLTSKECRIAIVDLFFSLVSFRQWQHADGRGQPTG